jgi:hypothetical protein
MAKQIDGGSPAEVHTVDEAANSLRIGPSQAYRRYGGGNTLHNGTETRIEFRRDRSTKSFLTRSEAPVTKVDNHDFPALMAGAPHPDCHAHYNSRRPRDSVGDLRRTRLSYDWTSALP